VLASCATRRTTCSWRRTADLWDVAPSRVERRPRAVGSVLEWVERGCDLFRRDAYSRSATVVDLLSP